MILLASLLPVICFLVFLIYVDSFKLLNTRTLIIASLWGIITAGIALYLNNTCLRLTHINFSEYSKYVAPVIEEILKMMLFLYLLKKGKVGFMIDGAIYGFSIGAFFALCENVYYFFDPSNPNPMVWVIRGFGTAMMHGGATAMVFLFAMKSLNTGKKPLIPIIYGTLIAMGIHSLFNHFFLPPVPSTIIIVLVFPPVLVLIFLAHEKNLRKWLDLELNSEVELLKMIREGKYSHTKTGEYIMSLRHQFHPEVIFDMLCLIELYTDLSIKAKSVMMLKETGFEIEPDPATAAKLEELSALRKNIGKAGWLAISPILRMHPKDLWKLKQLTSG